MRRLMILTAFLAACSGPEAKGDATAKGSATYPDDSPPPEQPSSDPMTVDVRVEGSGTLSGLEPQCDLEGASGNFNGLMSGEGEVDGDGGYVAVLGESEFTTPSGSCAIPDLQIGTLTSVVVHAALSNTQENCSTYCASKAKSEAEAECGSDADCLTSVEADYEASCETSCSGSTTRSVVAETSLGVSGLAALNAAGITGTSIGEIDVDLTFDHLESDDGETVDED
jgi:hypothetical protein